MPGAQSAAARATEPYSTSEARKVGAGKSPFARAQEEGILAEVPSHCAAPHTYTTLPAPCLFRFLGRETKIWLSIPPTTLQCPLPTLSKLTR